MSGDLPVHRYAPATIPQILASCCFSLQASPEWPQIKVPRHVRRPYTMPRQPSHSLTTLLVFLFINAVTATVSASSSSLFCKCSCLTNSTLIPISGPDSSSLKTCTDCNRQFCREYNLPFCKGVEDEDIFTTCFRMSLLFRLSCLQSFITAAVWALHRLTYWLEEIERDSAKDQAVVFIFIIATVGLLGYAIVRPWVSKWVDVSLLAPCIPTERSSKM